MQNLFPGQVVQGRFERLKYLDKMHLLQQYEGFEKAVLPAFTSTSGLSALGTYEKKPFTDGARGMHDETFTGCLK
jgi:hypothetical protein